jgi:hypothetical protein
MNPSPRKHGQEIPAYTDNRIALDNAARYFWQSFMTRDGARAELPNLTDIPKLARAIRNAATNPTAAIAAIPGLGAAHRVITPDCEPQLARVDRSPVATAHEAGWGIHTDEAGGFTVTRGGDANESATQVLRNNPQFTADVAGWPMSESATYAIGQAYGTTVNRA